MDMAHFRATLRALRKQRVGTQGRLSALTKTNGDDTAVNLVTISEIERGEIADPRIMTIARIVEAIPNTTLSEFFARIEALQTEREVRDDPPPPPAEPRMVDDEAVPPIVSDQEIERTVVRTLSRLLARAHEEAAETHRRQAADRDVETPKPPRDRGKRAGRAAQRKTRRERRG